MAGCKHLIRFSLLFAGILFLSFGGLSMNREMVANAGTGKTEVSFETRGEDPVIRFKEETLSAYFGREEKKLTVDGMEEIPLTEFLKGEKLSIIFHLKVLPYSNSKELYRTEPCKVDLKLSEDPVYWRFATEKEVLGVGNYQVNSPGKFRELLPKAINGVQAEYQVLRTERTSQEVLLVLGRKKEAGTEDKAEDRLKLSSMPGELEAKDFGKKKGETVGKLELMANYTFQLPLFQSPERIENPPVIQGKLTLAIWREVYCD